MAPLVQDAAQAGLVRPDVDPVVARMLVLGALNSAAEWWNPRRGSLDTVIRTAQSLVRHGLGIPGPAGQAARPRAGRAPRRRAVSQAMYLTMDSATQAGLATPSISIVVDSSACAAPSSWVTAVIREVARSLDPAGTGAGNLTLFRP